MKYLLNLVGFSDISDLIGLHLNSEAFHKIIAFSTVAGIWITIATSIIEEWSGLSIFWFLFIVLGSVIDILFGLVVNVMVLKNHYESAKMIRGIFKMVIVIILILLINLLLKGTEKSANNYTIIKEVISYMAATLHYTIATIVSLFILLGISENGAKMDWKLFISINKIFKVKIKNIEENPFKK